MIFIVAILLLANCVASRTIWPPSMEEWNGIKSIANIVTEQNIQDIDDKNTLNELIIDDNEFDNTSHNTVSDTYVTRCDINCLREIMKKLGYNECVNPLDVYDGKCYLVGESKKK